MINQLKNNETVSLYDGGNSYRDYIHVDDVVQAINLIIKKGEVNDIYNVGNGIPIWLNDTILQAQAKLKSKSKIENIKPAVFHKIVQTVDMVLDTTKLNELGYHPKYYMIDIIDELIT